MQGMGALGPLVFGFTVRWGWTLLHNGGLHQSRWDAFQGLEEDSSATLATALITYCLVSSPHVLLGCVTHL